MGITSGSTWTGNYAALRCQPVTLGDSAEPLARSCAIGAGVELRSTDLTSRRATRSGYQAVGAELVLISLTPYQVTRIRTNRLNARAVILKGRKGSIAEDYS